MGKDRDELIRRLGGESVTWILLMKKSSV